MTDGFEKLRELGSKKISSATHISTAHIDNILNKKFDKFQKPQFFGFLSIIEREFKLDLSSLKQEFLFARAEEEITQDDNLELTEAVPKLTDSKKLRYGAVVVTGVIAVVLMLNVVDFSSSKEEKIEINNTAIDKAKKNLNLEPVAVANVDEMIENNEIESAEHGQDTQDAQDTNVTVAQEEDSALIKEPAVIAEPTMPLYFSIVPKGELWVGFINGETHERKAKIITEPLVLDAKKEWLVVTGYGFLDLECGDVTKKFRVNDRLLFLYDNGVCQQIDAEEFKARNKGKLW